MITQDGEDHQVDMLAMPNAWEEWLKYVHRELKTNTDLDRGKKRDTCRREEAITSWMDEKGWEYDSGIFCLSLYDTPYRYIACNRSFFLYPECSSK